MSFFKKKLKSNHLIVPDEHKLKFFELYDDMIIKRSALSKFLFWSFMDEIFPDRPKPCEVSFLNPTQPVLTYYTKNES